MRLVWHILSLVMGFLQISFRFFLGKLVGFFIPFCAALLCLPSVHMYPNIFDDAYTVVSYHLYGIIVGKGKGCSQEGLNQVWSQPSLRA